MKASLSPARSRAQFSYTIATTACILLCAILALLLTRSVNEIIFEGISVDLPRYYRWYKSALAWSLFDYISYMRFEPIYSIATWIFSNLGISFEMFMILNKFCLVISYCFLIRKFVHSNLLMLFFAAIFVVSPIFSGYTENLLRQSMAFSLFLLAYIRLLEGDVKRFAIIASSAALMHYSSILWSLIAILTAHPFIYRRFGIIAVSVLAVAALYVADVPLRLSPYIQAFGNLIGVGYVNFGDSLISGGYVIGFKWKFLIASLVLMGGCGVVFLLRGATEPLRKVMAMALLLTAAYMLCSGFPFYDRLATVSWSFIPAVWGAASVALLRAMARREARPRKDRELGAQLYARDILSSSSNRSPGQRLDPRSLRYR